MNLKLQPVPPTAALQFHRAPCSERGHLGAPRHPRANISCTEAANGGLKQAGAPQHLKSAPCPPARPRCATTSAPPGSCHTTTSTPFLARTLSPDLQRNTQNVPKAPETSARQGDENQSRPPVSKGCVLAQPRVIPRAGVYGLARDRFTLLLRGPKCNFAYHDITSRCYGNCYTTMH